MERVLSQTVDDVYSFLNYLSAKNRAEADNNKFLQNLNKR